LIGAIICCSIAYFRVLYRAAEKASLIYWTLLDRERRIYPYKQLPEELDKLFWDRHLAMMSIREHDPRGCLKDCMEGIEKAMTYRQKRVDSERAANAKRIAVRIGWQDWQQELNVRQLKQFGLVIEQRHDYWVYGKIDPAKLARLREQSFAQKVLDPDAD